MKGPNASTNFSSTGGDTENTANNVQVFWENFQAPEKKEPGTED